MLSGNYIRLRCLLLAGLLQLFGSPLNAQNTELCVDRGAYGKYFFGDTTHADKVIYAFQGLPGDVEIEFEVWDNDYISGGEKIEILINQTSVIFAPATGNREWSDIQRVTLPDNFVNDESPNLLIFDHVKNPPESWEWAVRNVDIVGCVKLAWDSNTEPDLAGYKLYWGTMSGNYSNILDVGNPELRNGNGNGNEWIVTGLVEEVEYFFVATAYDFSDNESDYSEEITHKKPSHVNAAKKGKIRINRVGE